VRCSSTSAARERIVENLGSGADGGLSAQATEAAHSAFIHALSTGMWLAAGMAAAGVAIAYFTIAPKDERRPDPATRPDAAAEASAPS
jgi:hypothetical protein